MKFKALGERDWEKLENLLFMFFEMNVCERYFDGNGNKGSSRKKSKKKRFQGSKINEFLTAERISPIISMGEEKTGTER